MQYRLRTLLIVLALGPMVLASVWIFPTLAAITIGCIGFAAVILPIRLLVWRKGGL